MSCLLDQVAAISNTSELVQWLCPHLSASEPRSSPLPGPSPTHLSELEWGEDWGGWDDVDPGGGGKTESSTSEVQRKPSPSQAETTWLSKCIIAVSPTCDLMTIAYKNRLVILSCRWEKMDGEDKMTLVNTWRGTVGFSTSDEISAVLCLPLISQNKSSTGGPDWTCVVVGFTSGYVAMYTETGLVLLSQLFEEGEVVCLKCRTAQLRPTLAQDLTEELVVLYPRAITTIDGFSLLQTLRGCRNQVAKAAASGGDSVSVPPLGYKKWGLVDQGLVTDIAAPGLSPSCLYDHLAQVSNTRGFTNFSPSGVPSMSLLITTGQVPYVGFLTAREGSAPPFVEDVARLYASKLKNALVSAASGWLFGKAKTEEVDQAKVKPKIEKATPLPYRWSIPDKKRVGVTVSLASGRRLAAVTDDFGRVTLVDVQRGVALRMWKGYREADCGWVEVEGEWSEARRTTCFLLIYAPRRGLLEVWTPQNGPCTAAFNVPKQSRLLYTSHTLLGASTVRGLPCRVFPVVFITPDGHLREVAIPFHLALGGKTTHRARDLLLVKSLKTHLRGGREEEVLAVLAEVKTLGVRRQAAITLITSHHLTVTLLQGLLDLYLPLYTTVEVSEGQKMDHESRLFRQQLVRLGQLLHLYTEISQLHTHREASPDPDHDDLVMELAKLLVLTPDETKEVISSCGQSGCFKSTSTKKVTFSKGCLNLSVGSFLRCWDTMDSSLVKDPVVPVLPINLKDDLQEEKKLRLAEFLYGWAWRSESMSKFKVAVESCGGDPEALLHVAFANWLQSHDATTVSALHFGTILHTLAILAERGIVCDISEQSPWWSRVRDKLTASVHPHQAYLAALLCRGVHASLETRAQLVAEKEMHVTKKRKKPEESENMEIVDCTENKSSRNMKDKDTIEDMEQEHIDTIRSNIKFPSLNDWEGLSMEMVEWNLVLWQLQSVMPLSQLLCLKPAFKHRQHLCITPLEVSVKVLLDKGRGYVAELLANWFISSGLPLPTIVRLVLEQDKNRKRKQQEAIEVDDTETAVDENNSTQATMEEGEEVAVLNYEEINELLTKVGELFPHSVAGDAVLTNITWELAAGWHKAQDEVCLLTLATTHLSVIANSHIRHGVGVMVWETWLGRWVQLASGLMEKTGRAPRDQTCKRDLGMAEHNLAPALHAAAALLNQLMEANVVCEVEKPVVLTGDRLWSGQEGSPALVEVTVMQKSTCYDLLHLHHQLLSVLHLMVLHGIKNMRPLSCFDGKSRSMLFKPLSTSWTGGGLTDPVVAKSRKSLLCKIITATVTSLPDNTRPTQAVSTSVRVALELGYTWGISVDALRRHHVCELYNSGFDTLAEEVLPTINEHASLGSQLVLLAGRRLHHLLLISPRTAHHLALTSPTVTEWVKSCDTSVLRYPGVALEMTVELLTRALNLLPESIPEHKLATELYHTLTAFVQDLEANSSPPLLS